MAAGHFLPDRNADPHLTAQLVHTGFSAMPCFARFSYKTYKSYRTYKFAEQCGGLCKSADGLTGKTGLFFGKTVSGVAISEIACILLT